MGWQLDLLNETNPFTRTLLSPHEEVTLPVSAHSLAHFLFEESFHTEFTIGPVGTQSR